jgi:hypothetical protein
MGKISVSELIKFIQNENMQLEQSEYSMNKPRRNEEWMFSNNEVPPMWSNKLVNINQPFSHGQPLLAPLSVIKDADFPRGAFRFPFEYEFDKEIIQRGVTKNSGTDALAWYRPFHIKPHEKWGITILDQGIWYLAKFIAAEMYDDENVEILHNSEQSESILSECFDVALDFLYYHELFHFKVELAATIAELNSNTSFYRDYWFNGFNSESETIQGKSPLEEALANSFARNKAIGEVPTKNRTRVRKALDSFIKSQPDGYKDAHSVRGKKTFRLGVEELICKLVNIPNPLFDTNKLILEHVFFDGIHGKEDWLDHYVSQVPCRIIKTGFAQGLFSAPVENLFLSEFCATKTFRSDYKNVKQKHVLEDFQKAMHEWEPKLGRFRTTGRDLKPFRGLKGKRNVREFRVRGKESWRVYFEKFETGEKLLLKMHLKTPGKQNTAKNSMNKRSYDSWTIFKHNESCEHQ